ncbi:hypothetical protein GCM10027347_52630 [Larkinella harenae]
MHSFRLITSIESIGVTAPVVVDPKIEEPIKFADVKIQGDSDEKYHGFLYNYSEDGILLEFTCESAHSLISEQYYKYGSDLDIRFQIIHTDDSNVETVDFDGMIKGDSIVIQPGRVKAKVEQKGIHQLVDSRFDSPISLDAKTTLDGKALTPPAYKDLRLPGQAIQQGEESNRVQRDDYSAEVTGVPAMYFFVTPNTDELPPEPNSETPKVESIASLKRSIGGVTANMSPEDLGGGQSMPFLRADATGTFKLEFDWVFTVEASMTKANPLDFGAIKFAAWGIKTMMVTVSASGQRTEKDIAPLQRGSGDKTHLDRKTVEVHVNETLTLERDDRVFIYSVIQIGANKPAKKITVNVSSLQVRIKLATLTKAEPSKARVWLLSDAIRHVLRCITNQSDLDTNPVDPLLSGLLDAGPAGEYMVTNGLCLRGLPSAGSGFSQKQKAPSFTLKQLLGVLYAYHNAGMQYRGNQVQIEEGLFFYQDTEILQITNVSEYREEVATDHLFNQIDVGYEKYPTEGPGVREEFNTIRTYQTPLVNYAQKLEIKNPLIGAGTQIEQVRRVQFAEEPTTSHTNDDDGFILHGQNAVYRAFVRFSLVEAEPFPGIQYPYQVASFLFNAAVVRAGAEITITSGVGAGSTFKVVRVISRNIISGTRVEIQVLTGSIPAFTTDFDLITFQSGSEPLKIRTNDRLTITGIADPDSVVNAELSPARMLRQHAPFILNGLRYKPLSSELRCTFFAQNGNMISTVRPESNPLPGDPFKQTVYETGPVALGVLEKNAGRLFSPEWVYASVQIEREELNLMLAALADSEEAPEDLRRGYISIMNPDGEFVSGWIRMGGYIRYNPCSKMAEIKMLKRYGITNQVDCDLYRDWTFERFETDPTADPNVYLFCRFLDFN